MQTLIPQPVTARARYLGRAGRVLGFGLSARALLLLIAGVLWAIPAFFHPHRIWLMLGVGWADRVADRCGWDEIACSFCDSR